MNDAYVEKRSRYIVNENYPEIPFLTSLFFINYQTALTFWIYMVQTEINTKTHYLIFNAQLVYKSRLSAFHYISRVFGVKKCRHFSLEKFIICKTDKNVLQWNLLLILNAICSRSMINLNFWHFIRKDDLKICTKFHFCRTYFVYYDWTIIPIY